VYADTDERAGITHYIGASALDSAEVSVSRRRCCSRYAGGWGKSGSAYATACHGCSCRANSSERSGDGDPDGCERVPRCGKFGEFELQFFKFEQFKFKWG